MTYTPPTVDNVKVRFPEFANVPEPTLQAILDEAIERVGPEWVERDRRPATLYLTAHMLAAQGLSGGDGSGGGGAAVTGAVKRRKVGDVETEFAGVSTGTGSGSGTGYASTLYGKMFLDLMRVNFPAVAVV